MLHIRQKFIFIRHPETVGQTMTQDERAKLPVSHPAYPLSNDGIEQVGPTFRHLFRQYPAYSIRAFFHSATARSKEGLYLGLQEVDNPEALYPLTFEDSRLDEKSEGILREFSEDHICEQYEDQLRIRQRMGDYHFRPLNGENVPDIEVRIRSFARDYLFEPWAEGDGWIVILGHIKWFRIFQRLIHDLSVEEYLSLRDQYLENCSITVYTPADCRRGLGALPQSTVPWATAHPHALGAHAGCV
jgi:broad specificity phosphatase PhoE